MMSNSEKLQYLKNWNKIESSIENTEDNLKVLVVKYDGNLIDESRPYEIDDLEDEELYDYIVNMFHFKNIPILNPDDYKDLKSGLLGNKVIGLLCLSFYITITICQFVVNDYNILITLIPLTIITSALTYYNIKGIYKKLINLKSWENGELFKRNIECYKKRERINQIQNGLKRL